MTKEQKSAGAVIFYMEGKEPFFLLLKYPTYWGFPKGHIEPERNESEDIAAKREIKEETGLEIKGFIDGFKKMQRWYYTSREGDKKEIIKKSCAYFLVEISKQQKESVKISEEHEGFAFVSFKEINNYIKIKQNKILLKDASNFIKKTWRLN